MSQKADDLTIIKGVDTVSNFVAKPSQEEKAVQKVQRDTNLCYTSCYTLV